MRVIPQRIDRSGWRKVFPALLNKSAIAAFQLCQSWPPAVVVASKMAPAQLVRESLIRNVQRVVSPTRLEPCRTPDFRPVFEQIKNIFVPAHVQPNAKDRPDSPRLTPPSHARLPSCNVQRPAHASGESVEFWVFQRQLHRSVSSH